jgi:3-hydroxy-9,10-secoandrosta-1,3,5(10)-triene-9,17-dione monooxygenase
MDDLIARAEALAPAFRARAAETESARRPLDASIGELIDADILQMCVPSMWGGREADLATMLRVIEIISAACMSTGWIAAFYIGHNVVAAKFPRAAQEDMFSKRGFVMTPMSAANNLKAERTEGGWIVSGRAQWGSGIMHADWAVMFGMTPEGPLHFLMPASDVRIDDVWYSSGMAGTGSNDYVAEGVFVPEHRSVNMIAADFGMGSEQPLHDNPIYKIPFIVFAYAQIAGVFSGGLRGMVEAFQAIIEGRVRNYTRSKVAELPQAHIALGEAMVAADVAAELARSIIAQTERMAAAGSFSVEERLRLKGRTGFLAQHCRQAANEMMARSGASNFMLDGVVQRHFRDLNMLSTHAFWDWDGTREQTGRNALGLGVTHPLV